MNFMVYALIFSSSGSLLIILSICCTLNSGIRSIKDSVKRRLGGGLQSRGPRYTKLPVSDHDEELGLQLGLGGMRGLGPNLFDDGDEFDSDVTTLL